MSQMMVVVFSLLWFLYCQYMLHSRASAGVGKTGICHPLEIGTKKQKFLENVKIRNLIVIIWVNSCNDTLCADMTLTLHKSQVHCFGNMLL